MYHIKESLNWFGEIVKNVSCTFAFMSFTKPPYSYVLNQDTIMYSGKDNEPLYNKVLGLTNDFLYAVIVKYMKKNLYETKPFVIAYKFYQSLGP